jgi:hypothetical protein
VFALTLRTRLGGKGRFDSKRGSDNKSGVEYKFVKDVSTSLLVLESVDLI